jgi:hypothetical protein
MLLQWLGFGSAARQQLQNSDLLELLQLSEDQIDGLQINEFDKAELKRWQKATAALAERAGSDRDRTLVCSVQYVLYTHLSDRTLELAGSDIKPDDIEVSVEPCRVAIQAKLSVKLRVNSALVRKLQETLQKDTSISQCCFSEYSQ